MTTRNKILVAVVVLALIGAFLLGYLPARMGVERITQENQRVEQQLANVQQHLAIAELTATLGMMSYELNRNNYGEAAKYSTELFNRLQQTIQITRDEALRQRLLEIAARRDEITAHLAQADPAVREKVAQIYVDLYQMLTTLRKS